MYLCKDTYEYLLNFLDDTDIINMLSVNKKFRDELYFKRVFQRKYPLSMRFKDGNWRDYFIQFTYYLRKLRERDIPYLHTYDFDAKDK